MLPLYPQGNREPSIEGSIACDDLLDFLSRNLYGQWQLAIVEEKPAAS